MPLTRKELSDMGHGVQRFSATFEAYLDVLSVAEYRADYLQHQILAMSYESHVHSKIVTRLIVLLSELFTMPVYAVHDSNRPLFTTATDRCT